MATADVKTAKTANLRAVFGETWVKILAVGIVVLFIGLISLGVSKLRKPAQNATATPVVGSFDAPAERPKGSIDAKSFQNIVKLDLAASEEAAKSGKSYMGDFRFTAEEKNAQISNAGADPLIEQVRAELARLDKIERAQQSAASAMASNTTTSDSQPAVVSSQLIMLNEAQLKYLSDQLVKTVEVRATHYGSAEAVAIPTPSTLLTPPKTQSGALQADSQKSVTASSTPLETTFVAGGEVCPVTLDTPVNTDMPSAVFVTLQGCGEMFGLRLRGKVVKGVDNFSLQFEDAIPPRGYRYKITTPIIAEAVELSGGTNGVATDVNRHWTQRLVSAGLLGLAGAERIALQARSQSTVTTGTGSTQTVDKYTQDERRDNRIAGAAESMLNVITKDVATGINRPATMKAAAETALGVRFIQSVKGLKL